LLESGEAEQVQERHCRFFLKFAEEAKPRLRGGEQIIWLNRMEAEHDNLCAVLSYAVDRKDDAEPALRLAVALSSFWQIHDHWSEGREWTQQALARTEESARAGLRARAQGSLVRFMRALGDYRAAQSLADQCLALCRKLEDKQGVADVLESLGLMAWHQSDYTAAQSFFEQSLALFQEAGNRLGAADALHHLGHVTLDQGFYEQANARFQDSLSMFRETGDKESITTLVGDLGLLAYLQEDYTGARSFFEESLALYREVASKDGVARSLNRLGDLARCQGDDDRAQALYTESLTLYQQIGLKPFIAGTFHNLGYIAQHRTEYTQAATYFQDSLGLFQDIGDKKGMAECLMGLAGIIGNLGQPQPAARLFGAAEALRESVGAIVWPANRLEYHRSLAALRAQLDEEALAAAWAEGRALSMEQVIELTSSQIQPQRADRA
jgi:tetratricopeptide (TPR) repeat protein